MSVVRDITEVQRKVRENEPLTAVAQTGTSLTMIERYYFRFLPNAMREKLAAVREAT